MDNNDNPIPGHEYGHYIKPKHVQYRALFERGMAVGYSDLRSDSMKFEFWDEEFSFPTWKAHRIATYNGYFFTAPIDELRKLEREAAGAPH